MAAPHFADAVAKYDAARIALFGVPYDHTCSFRGGSRFAPRAIREASYNFETYMMDHQRDLLDVPVADLGDTPADRKSTRLNSSHTVISYAVFCLKKKKQQDKIQITSPYQHNTYQHSHLQLQ